MADDNPPEMDQKEPPETADNEESPKVVFSASTQEDNESPQEEDNESPRHRARRRQSQWSGSASRPDLLTKLIKEKRASTRYLMKAVEEGVSDISFKKALSPSKQVKVEKDTDFLRDAKVYIQTIQENATVDKTHVEARIQDLTYTAKVNPASEAIKTVRNQNLLYKVWKECKRIYAREPKPAMGSKVILHKINLVLKPGTMYLVLGPPASGKTTLLKAISSRLSTNKGETIEGSVLYNGLSLQDKAGVHVENLITFISQNDDHAPRLTVFETFNFAFQCKSGGRSVPKKNVNDKDGEKIISQLDKDCTRVHLVSKGLGLSNVESTFVGNNEVRGVSGGQRRRVTTGEMFQKSTPIMCADEISTGLDAQSTYDIVEQISNFAHVESYTRVLSLLQPSPETVSLFDEVILISEGRVLYAGPVEEVEDYFSSLGYTALEQMDVADFLQVVSTADGAELYVAPEGSTRTTPYTIEELADAFCETQIFQGIEEEQKAPWETKWELGGHQSLHSTQPTWVEFKQKYANSFPRSAWLNVRRNIIIWLRDKRFLIANAIKNVIMGVSVGGVFFQTDILSSIYGVLFQLMLFIMLGAMTTAPDQVSDRSIFYKHADDNFYGAFAYVIGKSTSMLPQSLMDVLIFGTIIYWMVGLAPAASNFFIFIAILFCFSVVMNQMLGIFAAVAPTKATVQASSSCVLLFLVLFCGFIVAPTVIPNYYIWIYWWNPLAWAYRALVVNEFTSSGYDSIVPGAGLTEGEIALNTAGFVWNGEPFGREWVGYAFAYLVPYTLLCILISGLCYMFIRADSGGGASPSPPSSDAKNEEDSAQDADVLSIPFTPVTLSFSNLNYDVKASTGKQTLRLLHDVTGIFEAGRMCALMGESGAGKTTLMDVIALRKTTGTVTGDVRLNGFEQERISFRRCSGYVEQFDVQATELTVRETVQYSARLRLNSEDPALAGDEIKDKIVDETLKVLELTPLADCLVGTSETGGLSFEQKKRLSIAVELAASPSIIFLDEPTSGLDARAALLVVKVLRKIADEGRTVIATIHQPSSPVFELFDDLCLLKKGGRVVFFGELGGASSNLVRYLESKGASPISTGENPANWMFTAISSDVCDFIEEWNSSPDFQTIKDKDQAQVDNQDPNLKIHYDTKYATKPAVRRGLTNRRLRTIYSRSPAYNLTRMVVSMMIGFVMGSVFVTKRKPAFYTEQQLTSLFATIFLSFIIIGVLSITQVLPVMLEIRDNFYRERAAGMVDSKSLALALGYAEKRFIVLSSFLFCIIFLPMLGINNRIGRNFAFWGFFTFNLALYSYFGQAFMAMVRGMSTAQILASVFIGINNFFSGFIVRPQYLSGIFAFTYWITPGHYVYEGLIVTSFHEDQTTVVATFGSQFQDYICPGLEDANETCQGTVSDFVDFFFGGKFQWDHLWYDAVVLGGLLILSRLLTFASLKYFNYTST